MAMVSNIKDAARLALIKTEAEAAVVFEKTFPIKLLWAVLVAHKGLMVLSGAVLLVATLIGHAL